MELKDSGKREKMKSGSQRDSREGKGRFDLMPPRAELAVAKIMEAGAIKYGDEIVEWKEHPTLNGIEVSNMGEVRRSRDKKVYAQWISIHGYKLVSLSNQKRKHYSVHRLVAHTFIGESGLHVNHKDFNRQNNRTDNLELITQKENNAYSAEHGRVRGNQHSKYTKLTFKTAGEIRRRIMAGEKQKDLAKEYGVSPQTICGINKNRIWIKDLSILKDNSSRNWEKGQSLGRYLDSTLRHLNHWRQGKKDEPHLAQACWNLMCLIETSERIKEGSLPKELNDLPFN